MKKILAFASSAPKQLYAQATGLTLYAIIGLFFAGFYRVDFAIPVAVLSAVFAEMALSFYFYKKFKMPVGAYIAGLSFALLVQSNLLVVYLLGGIISQISKHVFRVGRQQVFNPSNIALLVVVYCLGNNAISSPGQWDSSYYFICIFAIVGFSVSFYARRFGVVISYILAFIAVSYLRSFITGVPFLFLAGTIIGVPQIIFACHMITDPKTSPDGRIEQIAYGVAIGILDAVLRWNNFLNPVYLALVIVCVVWIFIQPVWRTELRAAFSKSKIQYLSVIFVVFLTFMASRQQILRLDSFGESLYSETRYKKFVADFKLSERGLDAGFKHSFECFTADSTNVRVLDRLCQPNTAVVVADINNDGLLDVFFNNMKEDQGNYLYLNLGAGKFKDISFESGLSKDINKIFPSTGALFFDYDNDGLEDLFIIRAGCHVLYKNLGNNKFKDVSEETGISKVCSNAVSINAFDYDRDGFLDLYIGNWWKGVGLKNLQESIMPASNENSSMGVSGILLKNIDGKHFKDVTAEMGLVGKYHTWAIGISDFNHDSYPDLYLANDHGKSVLYLNENGKTFRNQTDQSGVNNFGRFAMNSDIADFNNNGNTGIFVTDVSFKGVKTWGNLLWQNDGAANFKNIAPEMNINRCGWSWGAKFVDLNRDGWLDIFNTNGYWSHESKKTFYYAYITMASLPNFLQANQNISPSTANFSNSAEHENCVYVRTPESSFQDVSVDVGAAEAILGKGVATIDYDNDGAMDIIVSRSQNRPYLYKNTVLNAAHWIGFKLIGTKSNRDAWGAKVKLATSTLTQTRELYPANGFKSQSDPRIYFGLANQTQIKEIEIIWPSGKKQILNKYKIDTYQTIREE